MRRYVIFLVAAMAAQAQGTAPKASAKDYPVQAKSGLNDIGAEYMVHSFSMGEQMYMAENYLVVEVAFFPPKGESVGLEASKLSLSVNGKKALPAQNPAMVAAALKHRELQSRRGPLGAIGLGGINVGMGAPRTQSPFPGGTDQSRLPNPPRAPDGDSNTPKRETENAEDILLKTALPEGIHKGPVSGFVYFSWQGKASTIKSIDLMYEGVVMKLR